MPNSTEHTPNHYWIPALVAGVLIIGILLGVKLQREVPLLPPDETVSATEEYPDKIEEVLRFIESRHVDQVDREELMEKVVENILEELGPHSTYIPEDQLKYINEQLDGNFEGIGIEFLVQRDTIVVIKPTELGPAAKAGIIAGDKIVRIDGDDVTGSILEDRGIIDSLRGAKGTVVEVGVVRANRPDLLFFKITRDAIPIHSVDAAYMLSDKTGYIKINRFSSTTHTEFLDHLDALITKEGMKNIVIDLRDNPGGFLQEATSILNQFFREKDRLLVYTEGRNVHRSEYETTGKSFFSVDGIAVLVDEGSASASEILAGALQDYDRGVIVGRRSFGKGLVQEQYNLSDGSAIRLTVARYYLPSGRSIQRDYTDIEAYDQELTDRLTSGELLSGTTQKTDTTRFFTEDGRTVYGGGGIIPDVFIPLDSAKANPLFAQLQPYIRQFVYDFYLKNRSQPDGGSGLLDYRSLNDFVKQFTFPEGTLDAFATTVDDESLRTQLSDLPANDPYTPLYLKARLAKHLYGDNGLYAVLNAQDDVVQKALAIMDQPNPLTILEER